MKIKEFDPSVEVENICRWTKEYFAKNGSDCKAIIGISGGKDSSVTAALLCRALGPDRVIGVKMPQDIQKDIDMANKVIDLLHIKSYEVNIGSICSSVYAALGVSYGPGRSIVHNDQVTSNTPARIRMTILYAIAALEHGRVANTCNLSEDYVGYSTKYGDAAGDFALLQGYTVTEILAIGDYLGLPKEIVHKTPIDGLCGKTDEENLGFTYGVLDNYLIGKEIPDVDILANIQKRHHRNTHKTEAIRLPHPRVISRAYNKYSRWDDSWDL